jgi:hypothetical protein
MRNKKFILGVGFIVVIILVAILSVFLLPSSQKAATGTDAPFGDTTALRQGTGTSTGEVGVFGNVAELLGKTIPNQPVPLLRLIADAPVSGAGVYTKAIGTTTAEFVRYVEKTTGNVRETPLATIVEPTLLSNKTLLRVAHTLWSADGTSLLMQRLNEASDMVFTYLGLLSTASSSEMVLSGRPLPNDIISTVFSPDNLYLAYLLLTDKGTTLFVEQVQTGERREVWTTPLKNLTLRWDSTNIILYTNPTSAAAGVVWLVDMGTGKVSTLMGGDDALAVKERLDGSKVLYSLREKSGVWSLRVRDLVSSEVTYLPMATLAEKCAWGPVNTSYVYCAIPRSPMGKEFVDDVYQGTVATDDVLWRFNIMTGEATQLIDLYAQVKVRLDVASPLVSNDGQFLIFQTRKNDYLWALQLPVDAVAQPISTTTPAQ